jgi:CelD/BcsL family acetyltransferase involved in cellulose biosynthesis
MRILDVLDPAEASEWDGLVHTHPNASVFHTAAWARLIRDSYGHLPLYLYFHAAGDAVALIPFIEVLSPLTGRRAVCLPFTDACGPLLFRPDAAGMLHDRLAKLGRQRGWNYLEFRGEELLDRSMPAKESYYGHRLDLWPDAETVFSQFADATKRAIRRATRNDLQVEVSSDAAAVHDFYKLHVQTRRKHGAPPQPFRFFDNLHRHLIKPGSGFTILARAGQRTAAGAIFLRNGKQAIYKFAASDPKLVKTRGNNLVIWEAIQHLIGTGCEKLHFGRTSLENRGLRRFKLSWGTEEYMIRYCRFEEHPGRSLSRSMRSRESGLHQRVFRHLPQAFNRLAGAVIYPHLD